MKTSVQLLCTHHQTTEEAASSSLLQRSLERRWRFLHPIALGSSSRGDNVNSEWRGIALLLGRVRTGSQWTYWDGSSMTVSIDPVAGAST